MSAPASNAASRTSDLCELITALFGKWRAESVEFLVLRNYEALPATTGNDVDILVRPGQLKLAERVLVSVARDAGYHLHNRAEFSPVSLFFFQPETLHQIHIDLFHKLEWRGFDFLNADALLDWRMDQGLFAVPHRVHQAVNDLLMRQLYHGYVKPDYKPFIREALREFPAEMETVLRRIFGDEVGRRLARAIHSERWTEVEAQTPNLRRHLVWRRLRYRPFDTLASLWKDLKRLFRRFCRPPGLTVVLLGADGSGKSSVAARLLRALEFSFNPGKGLRVHWKAAVFLRHRRARRPTTTDPHAQTPRGRIVSVCALLYHWLEYWAGELLQFRRARFRNGLVLVERYHYDFVVDPRRYRLQGVRWLAQRLFRLLPPPDLVFLLDAPPEILHARKPEVPLAETRRQREAYRTLVTNLPQGRIVDCTEPLELLVNRIAHQVLNHLEARLARRGGPE